MKIAISRMHYPITSLGPGKRVGLWFQGCSVRCEGCISTDTWAHGKNEVDISEVFDLLDIWLPKSDGVTITGGEPFDQPDQLQRILSHCRKYYHLTTFVYSGYSLEILAMHLKSMEGLIDVLMADPLDISQPQNKPLRGSDNQRLVACSDKGDSVIEQIEQHFTENNALNFTFDGDTAWFAGVPKRGDISRVVQKMQESGIEAKSVEDKRAIYE
ncbi:MAG: radical SAM protein [Candidatus Thiodiazotropha sp. (ex Lucinoma kastoroae)]|nr:radical SAM protein [Candidatus Thiodiazotropha sp. (ex Lucinoma kastoroae)]